MAVKEAIWRLLPPSEEARTLAERAGLSIAEAQFLVNRGIKDEESLQSYLSPRLTSLLDPMLLKDMDVAVAKIIRAVEDQKTITIYGDYDADGLTATALLVHFFTRLNVPALYYIPNRLTEGYGLNAAAVQRLGDKNRGLLITVDCGISNPREIALLENLGTDVVVTDHHQVPEGLMPHYPVVNPHRTDCPFPFKMLSGVGLAFFLTVALRAELRGKGWFRNRPEPDLREYLDLVALGTVADMVPLVDQNRILVSAGLNRLPLSTWPGLKALASLDAGSRSFAGTEHLSFRIAPRLNACGRMGDAETGIRALLTDDLLEAKALSARLNELNGRRQGVEKAILEQIEEILPSAVDLERQRALVFAAAGINIDALTIQDASAYVRELFKARGKSLKRIAPAASYCSMQKDSADFALIRLLVSHTDKAADLLSKEGYLFDVMPVVALEIENRPGTLSEMARRFAEEGINIQYVYGSAVSGQNKSLFVFCSEDIEGAAGIFKDKE